MTALLPVWQAIICRSSSMLQQADGTCVAPLRELSRWGFEPIWSEDELHSQRNVSAYSQESPLQTWATFGNQTINFNYKHPQKTIHAFQFCHITMVRTEALLFLLSHKESKYRSQMYGLCQYIKATKIRCTGGQRCSRKASPRVWSSFRCYRH